MTPPTSSPLSSNSFPSSTTSNNHDENKFPVASWRTRESSAKKGNATNIQNNNINIKNVGGPLTSNNPQQLTFMATASPVPTGEGWKVMDASPLPPRSSQSPKLSASPTRTTHKQPISNVKETVVPNTQALRTVEDWRGDSSLRGSRTNRGQDSPSVQSQTSGPGDWQWEQNNDPDHQEQALFEERLCEDVYGVAVRKINQNGKSNLRYVKCCLVDVSELEMDANGLSSSSRSVSSRSRGFSSRFGRDRSLERNETRVNDAHRMSLIKGKKVKVLTWGKKKDVKIPLERFVSVRKGKATDRTKRNLCPATRILSLITDDPNNPSLDIEAPTRLDRDKFARAFSRFLNIPLEGDDVRSIRSDMTPQSLKDRVRISQQTPNLRTHLSTAVSVPNISSGAQSANSHATNNSRKRFPLPVVSMNQPQRPLPPVKRKSVVSSTKARTTQEAAALEVSTNTLDIPDPQIASLPSSCNLDSNVDLAVLKTNNTSSRGAQSSADKTSERSLPGTPRLDLNEDDERSAMSSITGVGYDQEIVEELHMALTELRAELEESRTEAARAVKVAEQAIQSAENSSSKDWNSTVTHKAAEAAAQAQKRSAEAMSKARVAEERLESERKNASIYRKHAEAAEEEAGHWQTRAAAAEVQRSAISESLESERQKSAMLVTSMKQGSASSGARQRDGGESTTDQNQALLLELEVMRQSLNKKSDEVEALQHCLDEVETSPRKQKALARKAQKSDDRDGAARALLSVNSMLSNAVSGKGVSPDDLLKVHSEFQTVRRQFESPDGLNSLPDSAKMWAEQAAQAVLVSHSEIERLQSKLAMESATRRKLLHEVQDLRGSVRVYCRPRVVSKGLSSISTPSQDVLLLHRERSTSSVAVTNPLSFEFDGILNSDVDQQDLYDEMEEVCLSIMDGYNVCVMTYGQSGMGKTYTAIGEVKYEGKDSAVSIKNYGIHLRAAQQFFSVLKHRSERYEDKMTFNIVEVHNERLCDMLVGTETGEASSRKSNRRRVDSHDGTSSYSSKPTKLEIKTNRDGETVVYGLISVEVSSFDDVLRVWKESLSKRAARLKEQGVDISQHEAISHIIGTLKVMSTNITTGISTSGKIQFVDLAASNLVPKRFSGSSKKNAPSESMMVGVGNKQEWQFANKSMVTLREVVQARSQFQRSVPYRNSTITHLLSDSLEADTKVILIACVSSDLKDIQETACTLKFAQKMRKVVVGKATKHVVSHS